MDEMELVGRLKDVETLRPEAFEHARAVARATMTVSEPRAVQSLAGTRRRPRRIARISRRTAGLGLGIGVAAAGVAAALVVTSAPQPSVAARPASASATAKPPAGSTPALPGVNSQLMSVASYIKANEGAQPGNASLVLSSQTNGGGTPDNVGYSLYTDSGDYYWSPTESGLPAAIAKHENIAGGVDAREAAAALYAVNGDLATAREKMVNAILNPFGLGLSPAGKKALEKKLAAQYAANRSNPAYAAALHRKGAKFVGIPTGKALQEGVDNYVWNNSVDALTQAGGNPQIRAGVLRLLSTLPEVTVENSTTHGTPTLTLTAGPALFDGLTDQVLTIDAKTGIPISSVSGIPGKAPSSVVTFQVSRVTVADMEAGKF